MTFYKPVMVGDLVSIYALMEREGRTSMRILTEVWVTRQPSGQVSKMTEAVFTFVAVDERGKKRPLP